MKIKTRRGRRNSATAFGLFSALFYLVISACTAQIPAESQIKEVPAVGGKYELPEPSFLYVLSAESGTLQPSEIGGAYNLTLNDVSKNLVSFTDRPYRDTSVQSTAEFVKLWSSTDTDSFSNDPPNAALAISESAGEDIVVVELLNPDYDAEKNSLQFEVKNLSIDHLSTQNSLVDAHSSVDLPDGFGNVSLFIDNYVRNFIYVVMHTDKTYNVHVSWGVTHPAITVGAKWGDISASFSNILGPYSIASASPAAGKAATLYTDDACYDVSVVDPSTDRVVAKIGLQCLNVGTKKIRLDYNYGGSGSLQRL